MVQCHTKDIPYLDEVAKKLAVFDDDWVLPVRDKAQFFKQKRNGRSKWLNRACPMQCPCTASIVLRNYQMENILVSSRELKSCVSLVSVTQRCPGHRSAVNCLAVTVVRQLSTKCYNRRLGLTQTLLIRLRQNVETKCPTGQMRPIT